MTMWDKKETTKDFPASASAPPPVAPRTDPSPATPPHTTTTTTPSTAHSKGRAANIGSSLFIKGEVSGSEDLTVEGRVEGRIDLKDHNLTIAQTGRVNAEIHAKSVTVIGEITGNIQADEKVEITDTGRLTGDILAPRVAISDGAQFRGSVDMSRERSVAAASVASIKERIQPQVAQAQQVKAAVQTSSS